MVVPAEDTVAVPAHLSDAEADDAADRRAHRVVDPPRRAALSRRTGCWSEGTGGVPLFALQLAKLAGARVVALSSSDELAARGS